MNNRGLARLAGVALLLAAGVGTADESNFRPYVLGGRAAGMGGAFTAISDDGSGGFYNPGGLAFADRNSLSLSASVYGIASGTYKDALLPGQDFNYADLQVFPVSTSVVRKLGAADPQTGVGKDTLVFSVFVPDAIHNDDRALLGQDQDSAFFLTQDHETIWVGVGYARKVGRFGIGGMAYGLIGSSISSLSISAVDPTNSANFGEITARTHRSTFGVLGSLGVRYDASDRLSLGLSLFTPSIGGGSRKMFFRASSGGDANNPPVMALLHADDLHASPSDPLRIQGGAAWHQGPWTLSGDLIFLGPRTVENDADQPLFANKIIRNAVVDLALGGEYLAGRFPLRAGFYTDFSQALGPSDQLAQNPSNTEHLNRYGFTFSGGFISEHVRTDVGLDLAYGTGQDVVPVNLDVTNLKFTDVHELNAYVFLATSYEF